MLLYKKSVTTEMRGYHKGRWSYPLYAAGEHLNPLLEGEKCRYKFKQDRHCTYKCNIEGLALNHCCCGEAISITYSECVFLALIIQHSKTHAPSYIVICGLTCCTILLHIIS